MKFLREFSLILIFVFSLSLEASDFYHLQQLSGNHVVINDESLQLKIKHFFKQVQDILPAKLKAVFPDGIKVEFKYIRSHGKIQRDGSIALNADLVEIIKIGAKDSDPSVDPSGKLRSHKTKYIEAMATLIHETGHAYDYLNLHSNIVKSNIQLCKDIVENSPNQFLGDCEIYKGFNTTLSTDPKYLELAGWPLSPQGQGYRPQHNIFKPRTVDPYEFQNPYEHFAVNLEYFLLDPEFSCRKPSLYQLMSSHFQHQPFTQNCSKLYYVNPSTLDVQRVLQEIPLDRVYQIHYLHAAKGQDFASRWGHSMFRIVMCAPETKLGPDCMRDEFHHLVLSFRAFIDINGINSWKSLTGAYNTRLFIIPFREVKNSYTMGELRDLESLPLKLSRNEMNQFISRAIETHWSYDNQYYFLTNNCAVESLNLLRSSILREELLYTKVITPNDFKKKLFKQNLIDQSVLSKDDQENQKNGYLFKNHGERYVLALSYLTGKEEDLKSALAHIEADYSSRQGLYARFNNRGLKQLASIVILETAALQRQEARFRSSIFENSLKIMGSAIKASFENSLQLFDSLSAPYEFLSSQGYGIPSDQELLTSRIKFQSTWQKNKEIKLARAQLFDGLFSPKQKQELNKTKEFLTKTTAEMQNLSRR